MQANAFVLKLLYVGENSYALVPIDHLLNGYALVPIDRPPSNENGYALVPIDHLLMKMLML